MRKKKISNRKSIRSGKLKRSLAALLSVLLIFSIILTDNQLIFAEEASSSINMAEEQPETPEVPQPTSEETSETQEISQSVSEEQPETSGDPLQEQEEATLPESESEGVSEKSVGNEKLNGLSDTQKSREEEQITITNLDVQTEDLENTVIIGATDQASFDITVSLEGPSSQSVWLGYRLTLPEKSLSGGTWAFGTGSYSWLESMEEEGKIPTVQKKDGNLVIEGKVNAQVNEGNLVPGIYTKSITVTSSNMANNEQADLNIECWVLEDEATRKEAKANITISQTCEYRMNCEKNSGAAVISGYFNQKTGDFTVRKPADMAGYQYGRVYGFEPYVTNPSTTEKLDRNIPLSFDMKYQVLKKEEGEYVPETEEGYQPVLIVTKKHNKDCQNELTDSPIEDVTLGNLIYDYSNIGPQMTGDYSYQMEDGILHVSANNRNNDTTRLSCLVFVPVNEDDSGEDTRKLQITFDNLQGTSISGQPITDVTPQDYICEWTVYPKGSGEGEITTPLFSRSIYFPNYKTVKKGERLPAISDVSTTKSSTITDYSVNAINILIKFESGLELDEAVKEANHGLYSGEVNFLYGVKPDGKGWTNEIEVNHTQDYELRYYDNLEEAKSHGTVVAALIEMRNGIWLRDNFRYTCYFRANGDSGKSYVIVQDVKMWRGSDDWYETSWVGTNGGAVSQTQEPTDFMKPYDNPANTEGSVEERVYRRDIWPDGAAEPQEMEGRTWGDTVYIVGGEVKKIKASSTNLNGNNITTVHGAWNASWSNSTFNTTLNQRYVDRQYTFEVTGVGEQPISLQAVITGVNYYDRNLYTKQTGEVHLGTESDPVTYTPDADPTKPGTFKGGKVIDPENFTVPGDGIYDLYYTSFIGDITDLSKDAPIGVWWDQTSLKMVGDSAKYAFLGDVNIAYTVTVTKDGSMSVSNQSDSPAVIDAAGYNLELTANLKGQNNVFMLDVLPYREDGRGSDYHGSYTLTGNKITMTYSTADGGNPDSQGTLYYTTETKVQGKTADIFAGKDADSLGETFTDTASITWKKADYQDGKWILPEGTTPVAIMFCGNIAADERVAFHVPLTLTENQVGDTYSNNISVLTSSVTEPVESNIAMVTVAGRTISGTAWIDVNQDGIYNNGDTGQSGVTVKLYKADKTEIRQDANGNFYNVTTEEDGSYSFANVPESEDGYYIAFEGHLFKGGKYFSAKKYKGGASAPGDRADDSDIVESDTAIESAKTEVFAMSTDAQLVESETINQTVSGVNAGLIEGVQVQYEFTGGTEEYLLPTEVMELLPTDKTYYKPGTEITSIQPEKTSVNADSGIWKFKGYDTDTKEAVSGVTFTGTWERSEYATLTISNTVAGKYGDKTKKFSIEIILTDPSGSPIGGAFPISGNYKDDSVTFDSSGKATVQLSDGESVTISSLIPGNKFKVQEVSVPDGYTVTYNNQTLKSGIEGTLETGSTVHVVNTRDEIAVTALDDAGKAGWLIAVSSGLLLLISGLVLTGRRRRNR